MIYFYAFLILFALGIGAGFLRNNFKKPFQNNNVLDNSLGVSDEIKKFEEKDIIQENEKNSSIANKEILIEQNKNILQINEITSASPSIEEIKDLINTWLINKGSYLEGKSELNLSKIVRDGLIKRTIEQRQNDIKEGRYKKIESKLIEIVLRSQTSSRIVVLAELDYSERVLKNSGELVNETSFSPLKVRYILGFSNKSWKLVDYVSGI